MYIKLRLFQTIMKRRFIVVGVCCSAIIPAGLCLVSCSSENMENCTLLASEPNITLDYSGIAIPPNIAPLNFRILEKGKYYRVKIHSERGKPIEIASKKGSIRIPLKKWRALLNANKGNKVFIDVYVKNADNKWLQFKPIANTIAEEDIDRTLVYRFMKSIYNAWKDIGIYQRSLTDCDVSLIIHGRSFGEGALTRTYISYVDETGRVRKPFVLPQKDPDYYNSLLETYTVPELVKSKIKANKSLLARIARSKPSEAVKVPIITGATPKTAQPEPWRQRE